MKKIILSALMLSFSSFSNIFAQSGNLDAWIWPQFKIYIEIPFETTMHTFIE